MKYIISILMVLTLSCSLSGVGTNAATPEQCVNYDSAYLGWSATSMVASGLAGAAGVITPLVKDNEDAVLGLGISTAILGALGTAAGLVSGMYAARFSEMGCGPSPEEIVPTDIPEFLPTDPQPEPTPEPSAEPELEPEPEPEPIVETPPEVEPDSVLTEPVLEPEPVTP